MADEAIKTARLRVGTAGWAIPAGVRDAFGAGASNLARYATRFDCVEINSSFHRRHRASTWARLAASVPDILDGQCAGAVGRPRA